MLGNLIAAVALATPVVGAPVALKAPAEPTPSNVTLAWTSPAHTEFAVTWEETGDVRNQVAVTPSGAPNNFGTKKIVEAGQPNRLVVKVRDPFNGLEEGKAYAFAVSTVDAAGAVISETAYSPVFDTDGPPTPVITSVTPGADGKIELKWAPGKTTADTTPGDPLDVPAETPPRFDPLVLDGGDPRSVAEASTATSYVYAGPITSIYSVGVHAINEWSFPNTQAYWPPNSSYAKAADSQVTATVPKTVAAGGKLTVTGTATAIQLFCDSGLRCWVDKRGDEGRSLRLESRAGAGAAWQLVTTAKAGKDGKFTFSVAFPGTRDYRVVAPVIVGNSDKLAQAPFATAATTVTGPGSGTGGQPGGEQPTEEPTEQPGTGGTGGGGGGLPITGAPIVWISVAGGLLLALGAAFFVSGRLRRRTTFTAE
ncbi:hypothetical protein [Paractinoplanes atraurantiacus]|uniref:Fibronectin type-III domain-containing protein n=1 Tax=Paractinoplanes atraurantiacus TaxID=1036182 RepID=A0A285FV10_9ACTN|nr:hypothetical protein [Actinoplanes atraurantiacus]SNY14963.1 hypothetical protein SAMN05421748_1011251 [Actinoplanes atraurantiacus]